MISDGGKGGRGLGWQKCTSECLKLVRKELINRKKKYYVIMLISDVLFTLVTAQKGIGQLKKIKENVTSMLISMELLPGNEKLLGKKNQRKCFSTWKRKEEDSYKREI